MDVAAGMIVLSSYSGTSKYTTPASEPVQVTGGTEFSFQAHVIAFPSESDAATKP